MMASRQRAVPRLGVEEFHVGGEAAHGLAARDGFATSFPQTIGLSCSWDPELLELIGSTVGDEARAYYRKRLGLHGLCLFAPTVDMERDPRWGRTEEAYGEDPLVAGRLASAFVRGLQGDHPFYLKAVATPKHFYANNNELNRTSSSSSIDPRTRREYYLAAFEPVIREARAASLMTAYNAINGVPAMLHPDLAGVAKGEWGMEGFAVCDGGALSLLAKDHRKDGDLEAAAALSLKAGIDGFTEDEGVVGAALRGALARGLIEEGDLDRALARVLSVRFRLGQFDPPGRDPYASIDESVLWGPGPRALALRAARESIVLLENRGAEEGRGLPLDLGSLGSLAVLGPLADRAYKDWYSGDSAYRVTPLQAIRERAGATRIRYADGCDVVSFRAEDGRGVAAESWASHGLEANRSPGEPGEPFLRCDWGWGNETFRSLANGRYLSLDDEGRVTASAAEVWGWYVRERFSLEPAGIEGGEGRAGSADSRRAYLARAWNGERVTIDREGRLVALSAERGGEWRPITIERRHDGLAEAVEAAAASDAAILFLGNHPLLVAKEEIDRPDIRLPPAQERLAEAVTAANRRTVVVIVGSYPYALGSWRERAAAILYAPHGGQEAGNAIADVLSGACAPSGRLTMTWYREDSPPGDIMDYDIARRGVTYLYHRGTPLYPFGHGLGYSKVEYLGMEISGDRIAEGGAVRITARLRNAGARDARETVQLYASLPDSGVRRPARKLVDFARVLVPAGGTAAVELVLRAKDLMAWDEGSGAWFLERGDCVLEVGASSADLRLRERIGVDGVEPPAKDASAWIAADAFDDMRGIALGAGDGRSSSAKPNERGARSGNRDGAFLVFDRVVAVGGGKARFEAILAGASDASLSISFDAGDGYRDLATVSALGGRSWESVSASIDLPGSAGSFRIGFTGDVALLRFRIV